MIKVIGVRFRKAGKVYYFDPAQMEIKMGDHVIVETARGIEFGEVVLGVREVDEKKVIQPLKSVIRMATKNDEELERKNKEKEHEAFQICQEKIRKHELQMKLIDAEYTFDNNKLLFYFTADGRIDFRELVKDLAAIFKTRIELRQIGVRDETKILGGIGICGRSLCCHTYLSEFAPVSIKMAKEQNLSLNQTKISGVCGRLMCCLKHEQETYEELNSHLPGLGDYVTLPDGIQGTVQNVNVLRQRVKVVVEVNDEKEIQEFPVNELKFRPRKKKAKAFEREGKETKESEQKEAESEPLSMDDILMDSVRINVKDIKFSGKNDETSSVIVFPIEKNNSSNISVMVILRQNGRLQTFCSKLDATTKTLFINTNQHSFLVRGYLAGEQFRAQIRGKNGTDICDEDQYKLTTEHIYTGIAKEGERGYFFREVKTFSKKFFLRCIPLSKKNNDSGTVPIACCIDEFQYGNGFNGDPTGKKRYCLCSDVSPILFFDTEEDGMYQIIGKWTEKNQFLIEVQKENN